MRELPEEERPLLTAQGVLSVVVVPILVRGRPSGFLGLDDCVQERVWTGVDVEALRTAADAFGGAVELRRRRDERTAVFEVATAVGQSLELEQAFSSLYQEIVAKVPCNVSLVALVDSSRNEIPIAFGAEDGERLPEPVRPLDSRTTLTGWVATARQPLLIRDVERERDHLPAAAEQVG